MSADDCVVSTAWLAEHLDDVVVLEVAFMPPHKADYFSRGHIPGSHYRYWKDFCWHPLQRQFADPETMATRLRELGVGDDRPLVLVGDRVQFATYAYWVLTMAGFEQHARVAVRRVQSLALAVAVALKQNGMGTVFIVNALDLAGDDVGGFIPTDAFELALAPILSVAFAIGIPVYPLHGKFDAVGRIDPLLIGQGEGAGQGLP